MLIIGLAVVLIGVLGGGVVYGVNNWLNDSGPQPAEALPSDSLGYMAVDASPSGDQQLKAYNFLTKFPAIEERMGDEGDPLTKQLFEAVQSENDNLQEINYEEDIEPWLGDTLGLGFLPPADDEEEPDVVGALQVTDEDAAEEGLDKLNSAGDGGEAAYAINDGWAILHDNQDAADKYAEADGALADNEDFSNDMGELGDSGVMSYWLGDAFFTEFSDDLEQDVADEMGQQMANPIEFKGRMFGAVRFDDNYVELAGNVIDLSDSNAEYAEAGGTSIGQLPESTVFAAAGSGGEQNFPDGWSQFLDQLPQQAQQQVQAGVDQFEAAGFAIPGDLAPLFGESFAFGIDQSAVDSLAQMAAGTQQPISHESAPDGQGQGRAVPIGWSAARDDPFDQDRIDEDFEEMEEQLEEMEEMEELPDPEDVEDLPDPGEDTPGPGEDPFEGGPPGGPPGAPAPQFPEGIGARIDTGDVSKVEGSLDKLQQVLQQQGMPVEPERATGDGVVGLAGDADYAEKLTQNGNLGDKGAFQQAIPDADEAEFAMYGDISAVLGAIPGQQGEAPPEMQQVMDNLEPLQALGMSGSMNTDGNGGEFSMRVVAE